MESQKELRLVFAHRTDEQYYDSNIEAVNIACDALKKLIEFEDYESLDTGRLCTVRIIRKKPEPPIKGPEIGQMKN